MATQLRIKRRTADANAPAGLTAGEMAINLVDKKLYVGGTAGTNVVFLDSTSSVGLGTANTFTQLNTFSAGISASGATFSGPIQIPINTAPAITIGNDATRNLTLSSITRAGEIVQSGAANATLNIRQESGGVVSIGDYAENLNSTYISVDDSSNAITLNGAGNSIQLYGGGIQISGLLDVASGVSASGATFSATTASTSSTTGAVIVAGGVGIAKDSFINSQRIGVGLLQDTTNLGVGVNALAATTAGGNHNTAIGSGCGQAITSGAENTLLGYAVGSLINTGGYNCAIGTTSLNQNQSGNFNTAMGYGALQSTTASNNTAVGLAALQNITTGALNTAVGREAGCFQANGVTALTTANNSVYLGRDTRGTQTDSNSVVIGYQAIGLGANTTVIGTSSTTSATIYGVLNLPSGLSAAGATFNGTVNIGTTALISAPSATALAIRSQIPAGTGVTPTIQIICPSAGYTLTNQIATQKVFDLPQDTITLQAATTYMFEGQYLLTTGTTTHITSMSFVLTTATMTNCSWSSTTGMPTALNAATSGSFHAIFNSVAGGNVNTTSTSANTMITFKGIMRVDVGGTMVPNIAFSAQPGGTNTVLIGSYLKFYPIGANTINSVGTAIG